MVALVFRDPKFVRGPPFVWGRVCQVSRFPGILCPLKVFTGMVVLVVVGGVTSKAKWIIHEQN